MKINKQIDLEELYFGVKIWDSNRKEFRTINLFGVHRVKYSIAKWVLMSDEEKKHWDAIPYLFMDVGGRHEYEFVMCPVSGDKDSAWDEGARMDVYMAYVEPNEELLLDLVSRVTKASARRFLKNNKW